VIGAAWEEIMFFLSTLLRFIASDRFELVKA
jgi:hypothetical protein